MHFPLELMPKCLREAAEGIAAYTNAPPELPVMVALGEASLACQGLWNATAHRFDGPSSLFIMVLNRSGGLKSQIAKFLNRGRKRFEDQRLPIYEDQMATFRAEYRSWELDKAEAGREKADPLLRRQALIDLEKQKPKAPFHPKRIVENPSNVGLFRAFELKGPSLGVFSTDAGAFLAGHTMSDANRSKEMMTRLAKVWSGEEIDRMTGEEQADYYDRRCTVLWLVQGVMAEEFLSSPAFQGQGILARMLVVPVPSYTTPQASYADDSVDGRADVEAACNAFNKRIYELLMRDLATKADNDNELQPPIFPWSKDARAAQQDWVNGYCASYRNRNDDYEDSNRSYYERLEEHGARLATIFAIIDGEGCVSTDHAAAAHRLVEWLTHERRKFDDTAVADNDESRAYKALRVWFAKHSGQTVRVRDLLRNGPRAFRNAPQRIREAVLKRGQEEGLAEEAIETSGTGRDVAVLVVA